MPDMRERHALVHRRREAGEQSSTTHTTRARLGAGRVEGSTAGATFVWSHKSGSLPTTPVSPHRPKSGSSPRLTDLPSGHPWGSPGQPRIPMPQQEFAHPASSTLSLTEPHLWLRQHCRHFPLSEPKGVKFPGCSFLK